MITIGQAALLAAIAVCIYGVSSSLLAARSQRKDLIEVSRRSVYAVFALLTIAFVVMEVAFLTDRFDLAVVASHSSSTTTAFYKATAAWSSQEGSLLLWAWLLSLWSSIVLRLTKGKLDELVPVASTVLLVLTGFFLSLLVLLESPFKQLPVTPIDGTGLNPLLRHPSMMFHPPALYSGYTLLSIPFAFAVSALITNRLSASWITATRKFALAGWSALGIGILLGARWSYAELGWGGYWAWDAVENAALLPWLTATAFLHSSLIQQRRGMLKIWNVSLILATGVLALFGTFLVRSGVISSIHAFGASTLGIPFVVLISVLTLLSVVLVLLRRDQLKSANSLSSLLSRESIFLINNLLLVGLCFIVFWGTVFPLVSEAVTGTTASVGPPWFNRYTLPVALVLILFTGLGPALPWRRSSFKRLAKTLAIPLLLAAIAAVVTAVLGGFSKPLAAFTVVASTLAAATALQEFWKGTSARHRSTGESLPTAFVQLLTRNRRRYGGYTVHIGIAVLFIGIAASSAFQKSTDVKLAAGDSTELGGYQFKYLEPTVSVNSERISLGADIEVKSPSGKITKLHPTRDYFASTNVSEYGLYGRFFKGEATSEIGLMTGLNRDVWLAINPEVGVLSPAIDEADRQFADADGDIQAVIVTSIAESYKEISPPITLRVLVSPMVSWIWIGGLIVALGALIGIWPARTNQVKKQLKELS